MLKVAMALMLILATGTTDLPQHSKRSFQQGFTLLEILVVVIIIGIMISAVVALRGDGQDVRYLQGQAQRVQMVVALAQQQAIYTGYPLRMTFDQKGYRFSAFHLRQSDKNSAESVLEEKWEEIQEDALRPFEPERAIRFSLEVEKTTHTLSQEKESFIYFYPDGLMTAADIRLVLVDKPEQQIRMYTDGFSALVFELIEAKP